MFVDLKALTKGVQHRIETETRQIGQSVVTTVWLVHPTGRCRALISETWNPEPGSEPSKQATDG